MIPVSVNNFSSRLRALRTENGFTQKDIAEKVPCTQQFIFGLEVGLLAGLPVAFVIYQVAKVVVHFIEG